jgi:hypothetical protein
MSRSDGRNTQLLSTYNNFWDKDLSKDSGVDDRNDSYTDVVNGKCPLSIPYQRLIPSACRLLRRCNRALRIRLGQLLPFLSLLQRGSISTVFG